MRDIDPVKPSVDALCMGLLRQWVYVAITVTDHRALPYCSAVGTRDQQRRAQYSFAHIF
jgi:hypothetical protein